MFTWFEKLFGKAEVGAKTEAETVLNHVETEFKALEARVAALEAPKLAATGGSPAPTSETTTTKA